jgi:hypothetical protein
MHSKVTADPHYGASDLLERPRRNQMFAVPDRPVGQHPSKRNDDGDLSQTVGCCFRGTFWASPIRGIGAESQKWVRCHFGPGDFRSGHISSCATTPSSSASSTTSATTFRSCTPTLVAHPHTGFRNCRRTTRSRHRPVSLSITGPDRSTPTTAVVRSLTNVGSL